jgi:cytochrome-b5 reductase
LSPYSYTDHTVSTTRKLTSKHIEIAVPLDDASRDLFHHPELVAAGPSRPAASGVAGTGTKESNGSRAITVHHLMVKNPDLMIERPYTPVNDVEADGQARLVVKRVRGGEVGRYVQSLTHHEGRS